MCNLSEGYIGNIIAGISAFLFLINLIATNKISLRTFNESNRDKQKSFLDKQLFELQRLSFNAPFVEDKDFTGNWDNLKEQYLNDSINEQDKEKFLKYDVYTEMLFNYMRQSLDFHKNETDLLNYVDFKSWIKNHKYCWENPLQENSNRAVYGEDMWCIIDKWLNEDDTMNECANCERKIKLLYEQYKNSAEDTGRYISIICSIFYASMITIYCFNAENFSVSNKKVFLISFLISVGVFVLYEIAKMLIGYFDLKEKNKQWGELYQNKISISELENNINKYCNKIYKHYIGIWQFVFAITLISGVVAFCSLFYSLFKCM